MITSLHNADVEFYKQFIGTDLDITSVTVTTHKGNTINAQVEFFKRSAIDYTEAFDEKYPKIIIQNYCPTLKKEYDNPWQKYAGAIRDQYNSGGNDTVTLFSELTPLNFRYDVSIACKAESDWDALKWFMYTTFKLQDGAFHYNTLALPDGSDIADLCGYKMEVTDVFRTDGVYETQYTFDVLCWVRINAPVDFDSLETIITTMWNQPVTMVPPNAPDFTPPPQVQGITYSELLADVEEDLPQIPGPPGPPGPPAPLPTIVASVDLPAYAIVGVGGILMDSANIMVWSKALGICPAAINSGFSGNYQVLGEITNSGWAWTTGDSVFLNGTTLSNSPPATGFVLYVGKAKSATVIDLDNTWNGILL